MSDSGKIAAIVLAAGASSRFGSDKLLHPLMLNGVMLPLAAHSLLPWLAVFEQITVVVKPESEKFCIKIESALGRKQAARIGWRICADASQGMAASLACGINTHADAKAWLIGLADMPLLPAQAVEAVKNALNAGAGIAAASCDGQRGHPVGFASRFREQLMALEGDAGARSLLQQHAEQVALIEIAHAGIFADIDSLDDLQELLTKTGDKR